MQPAALLDVREQILALDSTQLAQIVKRAFDNLDDYDPTELFRELGAAL
jgi:hypothetical protein